jgi:hypothetical protein
MFGRSNFSGAPSQSSAVTRLEIAASGERTKERNRPTLTIRKKRIRHRDGCARSHGGSTEVCLRGGIVLFLNETKGKRLEVF